MKFFTQEFYFYVVILIACLVLGFYAGISVDLWEGKLPPCMVRWGG